MSLKFDLVFIIVMGTVLLLFNKAIIDIMLKIYLKFYPYGKKYRAPMFYEFFPPSLCEDPEGIKKLKEIYWRKPYIVFRVISIVGGIFLIILGMLNIFGVIKTLL